jgi:hypothetical protein
MNSRTKLLLLASAAAAALALSACAGSQEIETGDAAALVAAPAAQLLAGEAAAPARARRAFTAVVAPGDGLELAEESISEKNEKQSYEIDITFPQLKGRLTPNAAKFNRAARALVAREVREFRQVFDDPESPARSEKKTGQDAFGFFVGRYEAIHLDADFACFRFTLHGRGWVGRTIQHHRVLNFDLKSGRALELADLFAPGTRYLQALSAHSVAELRRQDEETHRREVARVTGEGRPASSAGVRTPDSDFASGAGPEADNYRAWNLAAEGVVVAFAACQVGGCADGEKEVLVPFSALEAVLDGSGPAARLFAPQAR